MSKTIAVIDGSLVAFRASAAGEKRTIKVTHRKTKKIDAFDNRTAFKEHLEALNEKRASYKRPQKPLLITDFEVEDVIVAEPVNISLHICNEMLKDIMSRVQADECIIYLDEGETFRHRLATIMEYKGNRNDKPKPLNLQAVKEHLVLHHGAKVVNDLEADDYINFYQYRGWLNQKVGLGNKYIAVTFDKDAFGNPGYVFDFRKDDDGKPVMKEPVFIDGLGKLWLNEKDDVKGVGRKWFYFQLFGDSADNYKANKLAKVRFGDKAAYNLLSELATDEECMAAVAEQFQKFYPEPVKYTSWDGKDMEKDWVGILDEMFQLARMRRAEDDLVSVEDVLKSMNIDTSKGRLECSKESTERD